MITSPLMVGVDLGTTLCKAGAFELDGSLKGIAESPIQTNRPQPAWAEQNPNDWIMAVRQTLSDLTQTLGADVKRITAIGVSAHGPALIFTDEHFKPLTTTPIWQDQRGAYLTKGLIDNVGFDWIGLGMAESSFGVKLYWASQNQSDLLHKARYIFDVKGFLLSVLTGLPLDEPSSSPGGHTWNQELFHFLEVDERKLPQTVPSCSVASRLTKEWCHATNLPMGVEVIAGLNDGAAATLGAGLVDLGQGIVSLSTNGVMRTTIANRLPGRILFEKSMFCYPYIDGMHITGGTTKCGGDSIKWLIETFYRDYQIDDLAVFEKITKDVETVPIGANGIMFLPYLMGIGTPTSKSQSQGAFINLGRHHDRADMARALLEGVVYALRDIGETFNNLDLKWDHLRFTGGGSKNRAWRQIVTDVLQKPLTGVHSDSVLGAAITAAVGSGSYPSVKQCVYGMVKNTFTVTPKSDASRIYDEMYWHYVKAKPFLDRFLASQG